MKFEFGVEVVVEVVVNAFHLVRKLRQVCNQIKRDFCEKYVDEKRHSNINKAPSWQNTQKLSGEIGWHLFLRRLSDLIYSALP